ncbi:MAG: hypothetical protein ABDI20_00115 [Candidatus Bipolaricaulaceae bacterium]
MERALASPSVQALIQKLEAQGWQREPGAEEALAFERAQILILRFTQKNQGEDLPPPPGSKPASEADVKRDAAKLKRDMERVPKFPSSSPAFLVYAAWPEREEALAVLREGEAALLHLYSDGERRFLSFSGTTLLEQLRKNERFQKFEADLKQRVDKVICGPAFLDQATNTAYIFVNGCSSSLSVSSSRYGPTVYPPPSSYHPNQGATYLVLAKALSLAASELVIDPESLWLLPHALGSGVLERKGMCRYTVIAGGRKPSAWNDLRGFGWLAEYYPFEPARPESLSHARAEPLASTSLTLFCWELADYPEDNILLRFKTDAELTIHLYNIGTRHEVPLALVAKDQDSAAVSFVGFPETTYEEIKRLYKEAIHVSTYAEHIKVPWEGVRYFFEDRMDLTLDEVAKVLLALAQAEREGRFSQTYLELLQRPELRKLVLFFWSFFIVPGYEPPKEMMDQMMVHPRIQKYIRALAVEFERRAAPAHTLQPQGLGKVIVGYVAAKLLDLLINAISGFIRGKDEPSFTRVFVDPLYVYIGKDRKDLADHWKFIYDWLNKRIDWYGVPPGVGKDPRGLYSGIGMELNMFHLSLEERSWLAFAFGLVYAYKKYQHDASLLDDEEPNPAFAPGFHHLLFLFHHAVRAALRKEHDHVSGFAPIGLSVKGLTEVVVVMDRIVPRETPQPGRDSPVLTAHRDIVVACYYNKPNERTLLDFDKVRDHLRSVMNIFKDESFIDANPIFRPHGLDIAAVVLPTLDGDELTAVKRLAEALAQEIKYEGEAEAIFTGDDKRGKAAFLIWKEVRDGHTVIFFSCFERKGLPGLGRLTKEGKEKIVRELTRDNFSPVYEYSPNNHSNSSNPKNKEAEKRSSNTGSSNSTRTLGLIPIVIGTSWSQSHEPGSRPPEYIPVWQSLP